MRPLLLLAVAGTALVPNLQSPAVAQCCVSYAAPTSAFSFPTSTYSYYGTVLYPPCSMIVETSPCFPAPTYSCSPCPTYSYFPNVTTVPPPTVRAPTVAPPTAASPTLRAPTVAPPTVTRHRVPEAWRELVAQDTTLIELMNATGQRMYFRIEFFDKDRIRRTSEYFWLPPGKEDLREMPGRGILLEHGHWRMSVEGYSIENGEPKHWGAGRQGIPEGIMTREDDPQVGIKYRLEVSLGS